ncbi:hypothetical protein DICVIV_05656 [Dictyocaulus viviparus]|uniref:WASH complex subunit 7 n=1 Tax=Dictyocaulus viviparus TaxID=29172 RepID=A0A0D8XWW1_DICVI|nr:hypothetical protein DICVIV_05656 [Dictyocaulus viviparus]
MLEEAVSYIQPAQEWQEKIRTEVRYKKSHDAVSSLSVAELMLKGARIADIMCSLLRIVLDTSIGTVQMSKAKAQKIFLVIENIKAISHAFIDSRRVLLECRQMACQQWRCHSLALIDRARISAQASNEIQRALPYILRFNVFLVVEKMDKLDSLQLDALISRLETFTKMDTIIGRVTDCSFLVFHQDLIIIYWDTTLSRLPTRQDVAGFLYPFCAAIEIDLRVLSHQHLVIDDRDKPTKDMLNFCKQILLEPEFRLHDVILNAKEFVSSYLQRIFYELTTVAVHDRQTYSKMSLLAKQSSPNQLVNRSSETMFRYGLDLIDGALPNCSSGLNLDVVQVMRSLKQFVDDFNYCLHQEFFIEKMSANRTLRVLTVDHMADSMRVHGLGVLNTSVNLTYQRSNELGRPRGGCERAYRCGTSTKVLLRNKFAIFNQFLQDEHIHAQLQKDICYFEENKESLNKMITTAKNNMCEFSQQENIHIAGKPERGFLLVITIDKMLKKRIFPPRRAEHLNRSLSQLTAQQNEITYMDKFRILVTQMGNALGFVRSMSSSAASVVSQMRDYDTITDDIGLPEDNDDTPIKTTMELLRDLREHASKTRGFIKMLIEVFRSAFLNDSKFSHLFNFYVAVPALMVNFVEHMMMCRDRLKKRVHHDKELTFTDDGFTMGIAYIISVLKLWPQFTSLNWFRSIIKKCAVDHEVLSEEIKTSKDSRSAKLRTARLQAYEREFKLLSYTFQSARLFFSVDDDDG